MGTEEVLATSMSRNTSSMGPTAGGIQTTATQSRETQSATGKSAGTNVTGAGDGIVARRIPVVRFIYRFAVVAAMFRISSSI